MISGVTKCSKCDKKADAVDNGVPYCSEHWFKYALVDTNGIRDLSGMRRGREMRIRGSVPRSDGMARR